MDDEFGILSIKTPGARRMQDENRPFKSDTRPCKSSRLRNPIQRLTYDSYVACYCAYMGKIVQDVEPASFEDAIRDVK